MSDSTETQPDFVTATAAHHPRRTDVDPRAATRAERQVATLFVLAALLTGVCVSVAGIIGFVGLVVPHLVRLVLGPMHRRLLPASILIGGVLVLIADTLARSLLPRGEELPVGVVTAILGGPFFCFLLLRRKKTVGL